MAKLIVSSNRSTCERDYPTARAVYAGTDTRCRRDEWYYVTFPGLDVPLRGDRRSCDGRTGVEVQVTLWVLDQMTEDDRQTVVEWLVQQGLLRRRGDRLSVSRP